jgi:hypothetical protein
MSNSVYQNVIEATIIELVRLARDIKVADCQEIVELAVDHVNEGGMIITDPMSTDAQIIYLLARRALRNKPSLIK